MKLFGVVITTRKAIMREQAFDAVQASLNDPEGSLRRAVIRVARSATKDHIGEWFETERARFESLPLFEDFARQQREHDLAEAEKAQPVVLAEDAPPEFNPWGDATQLRYGILGLLTEHGVQVTATIADAFEGWAPTQITGALSELVSAGLVEVKHGVYSATLAGVGLGDQKKEARDEDPDSQ